MPGGDRTGPWGIGPMSGRGAGFCAGSEGSGSSDPVPGRGFGMRFGRGRGYWGRGFHGGGWRQRFFAAGPPGWMRIGRFGPGRELETGSAEK